MNELRSFVVWLLQKTAETASWLFASSFLVSKHERRTKLNMLNAELIELADESERDVRFEPIEIIVHFQKVGSVSEVLSDLVDRSNLGYKTLRFFFAYPLTDSILIDATNGSFRSLVFLELTHAKSISSQSVNRVLKNATALNRLVLDDCAVDIIGGGYLTSMSAPSLQVLDIKNCRLLHKVVLDCPKLQHIELVENNALVTVSLGKVEQAGLILCIDSTLKKFKLFCAMRTFHCIESFYEFQYATIAKQSYKNREHLLQHLVQYVRLTDQTVRDLFESANETVLSRMDRYYGLEQVVSLDDHDEIKYRETEQTQKLIFQSVCHYYSGSSSILSRIVHNVFPTHLRHSSWNYMSMAAHSHEKEKRLHFMDIGTDMLRGDRPYFKSLVNPFDADVFVFVFDWVHIEAQIKNINRHIGKYYSGVPCYWYARKLFLVNKSDLIDEESPESVRISKIFDQFQQEGPCHAWLSVSAKTGKGRAEALRMLTDDSMKVRHYFGSHHHLDKCFEFEIERIQKLFLQADRWGRMKIICTCVEFLTNRVLTFKIVDMFLSWARYQNDELVKTYVIYLLDRMRVYGVFDMRALRPVVFGGGSESADRNFELGVRPAQLLSTQNIWRNGSHESMQTIESVTSTFAYHKD